MEGSLETWLSETRRWEEECFVERKAKEAGKIGRFAQQRAQERAAALGRRRWPELERPGVA